MRHPSSVISFSFLRSKRSSDEIFVHLEFYRECCLNCLECYNEFQLNFYREFYPNIILNVNTNICQHHLNAILEPLDFIQYFQSWTINCFTFFLEILKSPLLLSLIQNSFLFSPDCFCFTCSLICPSHHSLHAGIVVTIIHCICLHHHSSLLSLNSWSLDRKCIQSLCHFSHF